MNKEERLKKAESIRRQGYNCAQTVAMAFADLTGIDEETTARATAGFGGGIGGMQEVCGVVSASWPECSATHLRKGRQRRTGL